MSKNSAVNAKAARTVGTKRIENPTKIVKSSKNEEKPNSVSSGSTAKTVSITKKNSITRESSVATRLQVQSKTILTKSKAITSTASAKTPNIRPKVGNVVTNKVIRNQPMKAIHQVQPKKPLAEKNVMNTIHNVTVTSPPPVRKEIVSSLATIETIPRERTKTRTLEPEEVLILKNSKTDVQASNTIDICSLPNSSLPISSLPTSSIPISSLPSTSLPGTSKLNNSTEVELRPIVIKEAVSFEINFEKVITSQPTNVDLKNKQTTNVSDGDYEDDFDSYESDFESGSSTSSHSATASSNSEQSSSNSTTPTDSHSKSDSRSVIVPERKIDEDREFDSGTYELKGVGDKLQLDSIDEREPHSEEQNDSGFGYNNTTPSPTDQSHSTSSIHYSRPHQKSTFSIRGMELMKKINLDTMTFTLFDLKPISYDLYMKIYGHKNTIQSSSQTIDNMIDQDVQTDKKATQSMWTQFPACFIPHGISNQNYQQDRLEYGEDTEHFDEFQTNDKCVLEKTLKRINKVNVVQNMSSAKPIDYERLNYFLQKSAVTISGLLTETNSTKKELQNSDFSLSDGFFEIPSGTSSILDDTVIYYVYSHPMIKNFFYLVHRQKLITSGTFVNNFFVSVWSVLDIKKPIHIMSCWGLINCLEVHHNFQDVVIGGLSDGSLAVWNLTESSFWHQNIGKETVLVPTQMVSPSIQSQSRVFDFGGIVALKALYANNKSNEDDCSLTQICSLHEYGVLTIWTILMSSSNFNNVETSTFNNEQKLDHRSPWSKIQLIQSNIVDLRSIHLTKRVRPKSGFEKKKMYFESNLFNDAALRELHDFDLQKEFFDQSETFRCTDMEFHEDGMVFVATNKSFLISISISLSKDSLQKLFIDESNFVSATKLKSIWEVLLVGLSDGTVKVLRINHSNMTAKTSNRNSSARSVTLMNENNFNAKSCAIQNIIKEERKFYDEGDGLLKDRIKEVGNGSSNNMTTVVRGSRFINNQILLPAMSLNRDSVRWLDVSINLNCLIGLCGDHLRVLNFQNFDEIRGGHSNGKIKFAAIVFGFSQREYLVNLEDDKLQIHLLCNKLP